MNRKIVTLLIFFSFQAIFSQQEDKKISIDFTSSSRIKAIEKIEKQTNYSFFYIDSWFANEKKLTSKKFSNSSIKEILDYLFDQSNLNYFVFNNKDVILTKNSKIHSSVYKKTNKTQDAITSSPVLISIEDYQSSKKAIRIGKENTNNTQKEYQLSGYVRNNNTGKPIENLVILQRKNNIYATTNEKGFYSINIPYGLNNLETLFSGIENKETEIIIYGNGTYNFILNDVTESLDEIVLQTNAKKNIKTNISGVTQIKIQKIKNIPLVLGERDILKVATTLPGIKSAGEGVDGVNVRGGKSDQNLFLLDNTVLYNPTHFLGLFSAVNPFVTKDLKVYKGSIPAEFGGRISSVFDIISKDSNTEKIAGEMSIGPVTGNLSLEVPIVKNKSGLMLAARSTYSDWILKIIDDEKLNNSSVSFYDFIGKYNHTINDNNSVQALGYISKDSYSIASDTTNSYANKVLSINWDHKFNDKNKGSLSLSNSNYSFNIDFDGNANNNFKLKYSIDEVNLKLKMNYLHSKSHRFTYGLSSKLYNISPGNIAPKGENSIVTPLDIQEEKALENALYISDDYTVNKKLSLSLGLRYTLFSALGESTQRFYDDSKPKNESTVISVVDYKKNEVYKSYHAFDFRFSSRYSITEDLSLKASVNNSHQFIHKLTNNTFASPTDAWKLSDINIKPQEAMQFSLGLYKNFSDNNYEVSVEGYYKKFKNILDYKVGANFLLNEQIETEVLQGPGKSYGVEFLLRKNNGDLNGWISYSYSRSFLKLDSEFLEETVNNGNFFSTNYDKPHDFNVVGNYKLTQRFSFSANFTYQTGRPITYPTGKYSYQGNEYLLYSDRNKFRIPDYYRLDVGFNVEGNHKLKKLAHSFWSLSVYNLLGKNNPNSVFFTTENGAVKSYQSSIFSKPIPTITYNLKF